MARQGRGLAERVRIFAAGGGVFSLDAAEAALSEDRQLVRSAISALIQQGEMERVGHTMFKLLQPAEEAPRPTGRAAIVAALNKLRLARNAFNDVADEIEAEARHAIRVSGSPPLEDARPSFPMRAASAEEWES